MADASTEQRAPFPDLGGSSRSSVSTAPTTAEERGAPTGTAVGPADLLDTGGVSKGPLEVQVSPAEARVLRYLVDGLAQKEIARTLGLSVSTVSFHLRRLRARLRARSLVQLGVIVTRTGVLPGSAQEPRLTAGCVRH